MELIELTLWIVVSGFLFSYFTLFMFKGIKEEAKSTRSFFLADSLLFLFIGIARLMSITYDFFVRESLLLFLLNLFTLLAPVPLLFHLENHSIKTRRILSLSTIAMIAVYIIVFLIIGFDRFLMYFFITPPFILALGSIVAIYLYMFIKSSGRVKQNALIIELGISCIAIFWFLHSQFGRASMDPIQGVVDVIGIVSPIGYIVGLTLLVIGFFRKRE